MTVYITSGKGFGTVGYVTSQKVQRSRAVEGALKKTGLEGTAVESVLETAGLQTRRVSKVEYRNTFSRDPGRAAREMRITANQSRGSVVRRSFAVSYHPSEDLRDEEVVSDLDLFREKMGLEEHQAVIAVHRDRAHVHAHLVVNSVHPETHELWDSTYERLRSQTTLREIEQERGRLSLEEVRNGKARGGEENGKESVPDWRLRKAKADRDVPVGEEDLRLAYESFRRVKRGEIQTWPELQRSLDARGLRVEKKGRGGVLADEDGNEVPLSRVDRDCSFPKLEEELEGDFRSLEETLAELTDDLRQQPPARRFSALKNTLEDTSSRDTSTRMPTEEKSPPSPADDSPPADDISDGRDPSSGKEPSSDEEFSSDEEPSLDEEVGQGSWHEVRVCAQKVIETGEVPYRDSHAKLPSAEHRDARIAALKAIKNHTGGCERAEEDIEIELATQSISGEEREVILDAARALQDTDKAARWATGMQLLNRKQEDVLSAAQGAVGDEAYGDPKKESGGKAARARSRGRLRARMTRLRGGEAGQVLEVLRAKAAAAPTEEAKETARAQQMAVYTRTQIFAPELSKKQEETLARIAEIEDQESVREDRPERAEAQVRQHLKEMDEGEIEDLSEVSSLKQRRVLEAQVQLLGVDPEIREEFGPKDVPSKWQRKIYRQAKRIAECGRRES